MVMSQLWDDPRAQLLVNSRTAVGSEVGKVLSNLVYGVMIVLAMVKDTKVIGAIDQGTAATKFSLFDYSSEMIESVSTKHDQMYPEAGWVEHDPLEIWENTKQLIHGGLDKTGYTAADLAALGITNQRETTVIWHQETGEPLYNAIVWQDRRTTDRIEQLTNEGWTDYVRETTGLQIDAYYSAAKLEWLLDEVPNARNLAESGNLCFGTVDSWLVYNLTGEHVTDVTNASRTMLFDIHDLNWDNDLLTEFDIPESILPSVVPSISAEAYGRTNETGFLGESIPITGVLGDQQAALFGHAGFEKGALKHSIGTSCVMHLNTGTEALESNHGLNTTVGFQIEDKPPKYVLEGQIFTGGQAIEWLVEMGIIGGAGETEELARSVQSTDGVYFIPTFQGLATPFWNSNARGTILGLNRDTRPAHLVRATLEGIACRGRDAVDAMRADSEVDINCLRIDGGMTNKDRKSVV